MNKLWLAFKLAVHVRFPPEAEIFSNANGVSLDTVFHYHPCIVLI